MNKVKSDIVIVEDEQFIAKDMEEILKGFGYNVIGIYDRGEDLLEELKENKKDISIVLSDIYLKGKIDGTKLGKKLFELKIPVVFVTAYTDEKTLRKALSFPVFGFVQKPFDPFTLKSAVELALHNFSLLCEYEKNIEGLSKEYKILSKEIENKEKQLLEEIKLKENLLFEKEKLSREIVSFQYYADVLKSEIEKALLEKEKLQSVKSEIFEHLAIYSKGMEFFNSLFCGMMNYQKDVKVLFRAIIDEFKNIFDEDCKGITLYVDGDKINTSTSINTDFIYRQNFNEIQINIFFNSENSLKKYLTDSAKNMIDIFLKILSCFYNNRKLFMCENDERILLKNLFDSINLPVVYYGKDRILVNESAKLYFNLSDENEIKEKIFTDMEEIKKLSIKLLVEKKDKFFEYGCKIKGKDGILKDVKVKRSLFKNSIDEYVDVFFIED